MHIIVMVRVRASISLSLSFSFCISISRSSIHFFIYSSVCSLLDSVVDEFSPSVCLSVLVPIVHWFCLLLYRRDVCAGWQDWFARSLVCLASRKVIEYIEPLKNLSLFGILERKSCRLMIETTCCWIRICIDIDVALSVSHLCVHLDVHLCWTRSKRRSSTRMSVNYVDACGWRLKWREETSFANLIRLNLVDGSRQLSSFTTRFDREMTRNDEKSLDLTRFLDICL